MKLGIVDLCIILNLLLFIPTFAADHLLDVPEVIEVFDSILHLLALFLLHILQLRFVKTNSLEVLHFYLLQVVLLLAEL